LSAHLNSMDDRTPHNGSDLAAVHLAELVPSVTDGSLRGAVAHWLQEGNDHLRAGRSAAGGNTYAWDGEELKRLFSKP
jgi:hypothetical protein